MTEQLRAKERPNKRRGEGQKENGRRGESLMFSLSLLLVEFLPFSCWILARWSLHGSARPANVIVR
jgi:hypothetical protein